MNTQYIEFLKQEIFKTSEFSQFDLLFDALADLLKVKIDSAAIVERSYIYGGHSLFAPLLPSGIDVQIIDYRPTHGTEREDFQGSWIANSGFNFPLSNHLIEDIGTGFRFSFGKIDSNTLIIPNVLHHCRDFPAFMRHIQSRMPRLYRVFIFDSYLREAHQAPDDFCRFTPEALEAVMRELGFSQTKLTETGNVFDGILYLISQAKWQLENAPELVEIRNLIARLKPELERVRGDDRYRSLGRPYASLSTAYAMTFER